MQATMTSPSIDRRARRRRNVRLAIVIAVVALAVYVGLWLKAVL
jgi:hypothetical protein